MASPPYCETRLRTIKDNLALEESEETWDKIATALTAFQTLLQERGGAIPDYFLEVLRSLSSCINKSLTSERSRLSGAAIDLLCTAANELGRTFEPLFSTFLPTVLTLCGRPNKVFVTRAKVCLITIVESTQSPHLLSYLLRSANDKSTSLRLTVAEASLVCLQCFNPPDLQKEPRGQEVEALIRHFATDANADVRKVGRKIFEAYSILLPSRVDTFVAPLTPTIRKYLSISSRPSSKPSAPSLHASHSVRAGTNEPFLTHLSGGPNSTARRPDRELTKKLAGSDRDGGRRPSNADVRERAGSALQRPDSAMSLRNIGGSGRLTPNMPSRPRLADPLEIPGEDGKTSTTYPLRSGSGPLRPCAPSSCSAKSSTPQDDQIEPRRAIGGARRVLRGDPTLSSSQSSKGGPEEPRVKSTIPPRRGDVLREARQQAAPTSGRRLPPSSRPAPDTVRTTSGSSMTGSSRTEPVINSTTSSARTNPNAIGAKTAAHVQPSVRARTVGKVPSRGQTKSTANTRIALSTKQSHNTAAKKTSTPTVPAQAEARKTTAVAPQLIPLPPSRCHTPESDAEHVQLDWPTHPSLALPHTKPVDTIRTPGAQGTTLPEASTQSCQAHAAAMQSMEKKSTGRNPIESLVRTELFPATPRARTSSAIVPQTPISALVESIQQGFLFTPASGECLHTVEEGDSFEESFGTISANAGPWECKPLEFSKP